MKRQGIRALYLAMAFVLAFFASALGGCASGESTYNIVCRASEGGTLVSDVSSVELGGYVTVTATAQEGYVLGALTVNGGKVSTFASVDENGVRHDVWRSREVLRDYTIDATFVKSEVTIKFAAGEGAPQIADGKATYGGRVGALPAPRMHGKRFVGWLDADGNRVTADTVLNTSGELCLTALWEDVSAREMAAVEPYSLSTTYYDAAATSYGVVWHTLGKPIASVVQIAEHTGEVDWAAAREISATTQSWTDEYISSAVIDGLKFDTAYTVRVGDAIADKWSSAYEFVTRKENIDVAKFLFVTDAREEGRLGYRGGKELEGGGTYLAEVLGDATARFPDAAFIANGGNSVNRSADSRYWYEMLGALDEYAFQMPMAVTGGIFENTYYGANIENISKLFHYDTPTTSDKERGVYYSFDFGPMHFVSLRTNDIAIANNVTWASSDVLTSEQYNWLRDDLIEANARRETTPWIVVMMNEPLVHGAKNANVHGAKNENWVFNGDYDIKPALGWQLWPLFTAQGVDLALSGSRCYGASTYPLAYDGTVARRLISQYPWVENDEITARYPDNQQVRLTLSSATGELVGGNTLDVFDFTDFSADAPRGTVVHVQGSAGSSRRNPEEKAENDDRFRTYGTFGKNESLVDTIGDYSVYSYIEVENGKLTLQTYGVNCKQRAAAKGLDGFVKTAHGVWLDGFILKK